MKVRSQRLPRHFWADNELYDDYLPQIGAYGFAVYMALCRYSDAHTACADPSIVTIAHKLGISESTVKRAVKTLEDHALIHVQRGRKTKAGDPDTNVYTLLPLKGEGVGSVGTEGGVCENPQVGSVVPLNNTHINKNDQNNAPTAYTLLKDDFAQWCYGNAEAWKSKASVLNKALEAIRVVYPSVTAAHLVAARTNWYARDWRGLKGQKPKPHEAAEFYLQNADAIGAAVIKVQAKDADPTAPAPEMVAFDLFAEAVEVPA